MVQKNKTEKRFPSNFNSPRKHQCNTGTLEVWPMQEKRME